MTAQTPYGWELSEEFLQQSSDINERLAVLEEFQPTEYEGLTNYEIVTALVDIVSASFSPLSLYNVHLSGSVAEGVSTEDSDIDMLQEAIYLIATEEPDHSSTREQTLLRIHTTNVSPGHCMLELVKEGNFPTSFNPTLSSHLHYHTVNHKQFLSSFSMKCHLSVYEPIHTREIVNAAFQNIGKYLNFSHINWSGPANTLAMLLPPFNVKIEKALAIRVDKWPKQALPWLSRERKYGWPCLDKFPSDSFCVFVVPSGTKGGHNEDLEWTFAFNTVERNLVLQFNKTQKWCYMLLKLLATTFITPAFEDDVISSYCLKNVMFWCIEDSPSDVWQPEYLLSCLRMCLRNLLLMVEMELCPHYIIPEKNLFRGKVGSQEVVKLVPILHKLIGQTFRQLVQVTDLSWLSDIRVDNFSSKAESVMLNSVKNSFGLALRVLLVELGNEPDPRPDTVFFKHKSVLCKLINVLHKGNCTDTMKDIMSSVVSSLGLHLISVSNYFSTEHENNISKYRLINMGKEYLHEGCGRSVGATLVKLGTYYWHKGNKKKALNVVGPVLNGDIQVVSTDIPISTSIRSIAMSYIVNKLCAGQINDNATFKSAIDTEGPSTWLDVYYLPGEVHAVPNAIKIEMAKPFGETENIFSVCFGSHRKWAVIDPLINAAFLQFLCHLETGKNAKLFGL